MICKKCKDPNHIVCGLDLDCTCCKQTFKKMENENSKVFKILKLKIQRKKNENIPRHGWRNLQLGQTARNRNESST